MDHDSCSSSCNSCTSGSYSDYNSVSSAATSCDVALALFQQLENEIGTNTHRDIDLSKFAHEVWGVERDAVDKLLAARVALDETESGLYGQCTKDNDLHQSFLTISAQLLKEASKILDDEVNEAFTDTFWDRLRQDPASRSRQRLPDVINSWAPLPSDGTAPGSATHKVLVEIKRLPVQEEEDADGEDHEWSWSDSEEEEEEESTAEPKDNTDTDASQIKSPTEDSKPLNPSGDVSREVRPSEAPQAPTKGQISRAQERTQSSKSSKQSTSTLKRSFDSMQDATSTEGSTSKKQRCDDEPPLHHSLLPLYATEAMASSSRYYVVGLVVDRFTVTVCYFDRFLVTCVASFSFKDEPSKLALVLYAMNRCDRNRAGFDPHLRAPNDAQDPEPARPVEDVIGSLFEYSATPSSSAVCFRVSGVIRRPDELIGRATAVYKVQRRLPDGTFCEEEFVYKLSWPSKTRFSEVEVVETLKQRLPEEAHDYLPDFTSTRTFTAEDLNLPWLRLGLDLNADNHKDRVLRGMVGKFYHKLWEAGSIENLKKAWLDCVECLYLARKTGKVLHRDLSEGNLMVLKCPGDVVKGVLNDWDMARFLDRDDDDLCEPQDRTGTLPFMALDLVLPNHTAHWFRHDLESMFWILVWAALHYNLRAGTRDAAVHPVVQDLVSSMDTSFQLKNAVLTVGPDGGDILYGGVKPEFAGLLKEWIEPLRTLFARARMHYHCRISCDQESDRVTYDGKLTFKTFMAAIGATPRTWGIPGYLDDDDGF